MELSDFTSVVIIYTPLTDESSERAQFDEINRMFLIR